MTDTISFKIVKHIGIIREHRNGWTKELNLISWNGKPERFDIRSWDHNHERMDRGITLTEEEALELFRIMADYFA